MASVVVIPIIIVAIVGLAGYLVYRLIIFDMVCKRSVDRMLQRYNIDKTPSQIIREYHDIRGEPISDKQVYDLERRYRQNDPDKFLAMYDDIRDGRHE